MVHLFNRAGINLALDVGSGAVHIFDEPSYYLLERLDESSLKDNVCNADIEDLRIRFGAEQMDEAFDELCELYKAGLLYADDSYQEFSTAMGTAPIKAMCLHIAHDCNLRCRYCFASTGGFGGTRKLMDFDTAKKAIDLLVRLSEGRRNLEVDFFGGEPLMNFDVVMDTIQYARGLEAAHGKNFRFTITTNGILLNDDYIEKINREMSNVVLSLDGRRDVNDKMRPCVNGAGSFDVIVPKMQQLVESRGDKEYYVRGTYTRDNTDFDKDVLALYDLGFDQISVEPVVGPPEDNYTIQDTDVKAIEQSYERLMNEMVGRRRAEKGDFNFFHFMLDLDNGPCAIKRLKGCGSGNEYLAVTPDGELYPCHQFVGNPDFLMGTVDAGVTRQDLRQRFSQANLLNKPECMTCWAKFFCSGGCNANNYNLCGSELEPHKLSCDLEKIRLECAIAIQAALCD